MSRLVARVRSQHGVSIGLAALACGAFVVLMLLPGQTTYAQGPGGMMGGPGGPMGGGGMGGAMGGGPMGAAAAPGGAPGAPGAPAVEEPPPVLMPGGGTDITRTPIYIDRPETQKQIAAEMERLGQQAMGNIPRYYHERLRESDWLVNGHQNAVDAYRAELDRIRDKQAEALNNRQFELADQYALMATWVQERLDAVTSNQTAVEVTSAYYGTHRWWQGAGRSATQPSTDQQSTRRTFQSAHVGTSAAAGGGMMGGMGGPGMMGPGGPGGMMGAAGPGGMMGPGGSGGPGMMGRGGPGMPGMMGPGGGR